MRMQWLALVLTMMVAPAWAQMRGPAGAGEGRQQLGPKTIQLLKPDMEPAVGATVIARVFSRTPNNPSMPAHLIQERIYTAGAQGEVTIDVPIYDLPPIVSFADYAIIQAPGCCLTVMSLSQLPNQITLLPAETMEVKLTLPNGQPAVGATFIPVAIRDYYYFFHPACGVSTPQLVFRSDTDGIVRFPVINSGAFTRIAITELKALAVYNPANNGAPTHCAFPISMTIPPRNTPVPVTLQEAGTLTGTVTPRDGKPLPGVKVMIATLPMEVIETDARGIFRFNGIPVKSWKVEVSHPDFARTSVTSTTNFTTPLSIAMNPLITLRGRVVDADTGAAITETFSIRAMFFNENEEKRTAGMNFEMFTTAADGTFTVRVPAACGLIALRPGYAGTVLEGTFTNGANVVLTVRPGRGGR